MTVAEARELTRRQLESAGVDSPGPEALALLEAATGLARAGLLLRPERPLAERERLRLLAMLKRRMAREPLQHILGVAAFYGLELAVEPGVLVPRPETERLVELALQRLVGVPSPRVLDVGTGCGAIALAVRAERADAEVMAADVAPAAVRLARRNAERLGLALTARRSDLLADAAVAAFAARCHALLANLPYLPAGDAAELQPEVRHDPEAALFSGEDGLALARRLIRQSARLLQEGALLALELDPRNVQRARRAVAAWRDVTVETDLAGRERYLLAVR